MQNIELERVEYQESILGSRNTNMIFKHFKNLKKQKLSLPREMELNGIKYKESTEKVEKLNKFFHSVFTPKLNFKVTDIACENASLINFDVSQNKIRELLTKLDVTKSKGPDGLPPCFLKSLAKPMSSILNAIFKNIKRVRCVPKFWKSAAISPIHKKNDKRQIKNYKPVSLLTIISKVLKKCMYEPLYDHFQKYMKSSQHGFVKKKSVVTNLLAFLQRVYEALDKNPNNEVLVYYTDFSKAFDKVPHFELLKKVANIGVGGCFLEVLASYLENRTQWVKCENVTKLVTSGVPQGSLLGPLLFCIFINDLPEVLKFTTPFIYADDLKLFSAGLSKFEIQSDISALENWVNGNKMELAPDKCKVLIFRGNSNSIQINGHMLESVETIKDLGVHIDKTLSWSNHLMARMKKANQIFYFAKRNVAKGVSQRVKLGVYKSAVLPLITFASSCFNTCRANLSKLERFQKRALKRVTNSFESDYLTLLKRTNTLPLTMFIQLLNLLNLSSFFHSENDLQIRLLTNKSASNTRQNDGPTLSLKKVRTEKARAEFCFRLSRVANHLPGTVDFFNPTGLKNRLLNFMWTYQMAKFNEANPCTWILFCDCRNCMDVWKTF